MIPPLYIGERFCKSTCLSGTSLTHTLTHTGKYPYGTSGTRSVKENSDSQRKGLKMSFQHHLKGGTFRNQQVARSSRITSSRKKRLPNQGVFSFWSIGFCNLCKTFACGQFSASLLGDRNLWFLYKCPFSSPATRPENANDSLTIAIGKWHRPILN